MATATEKNARLAKIAADLSLAQDKKGLPVYSAFTRAHIQELHNNGFTRDEAAEVIIEHLGAANAQGAIKDLDSYGDWGG